MLKIVAISDTHTAHDKVVFSEIHNQADILICGGDFSFMYAKKEGVKEFLDWFASHPQKYKILIGGNHDFFAEENDEIFRAMIPEGIIYLNNETVEIEGYKFFGSPNTPNMPMWAFSKMEKDMPVFYENIPNDVDVLITHTPPFGILDKSSKGINCGSTTLLDKISTLEKLKLNIFGHVHNAHGILIDNNVTYANVSVYNEEPPTYLELE